MKIWLTIITAILLCGCANFYTTTVTITQVRSSAIHEMARLYKLGMVSPELDKKFEALDEEYMKAAYVAEQALIAYKEGIITEKPVGKVLAVKLVVNKLLDVLTPMLAVKDSSKLQSDLVRANNL